ncbi:MAG: hypothetical protein ACD_2C00172G0005 [uncultured bacterium (gcode 4)]|uniref:Uncharacterized protein n=1 Tax=uncultured bacterium (gcode 4) TaxID=1234023 RepID=K2G591_9BACT|nr:MAG: hypothetical protein ACD_2C00172G0005 [uncultured bacterium (gcode 4)]
MKKIDFSYLKKKFKLTDDDIRFLNDFFNQDEVFKKLNEIRIKRNALIGKFLILPIIIVILIISSFIFDIQQPFGVWLILFLFWLPISVLILSEHLDVIKFDFKSEILTKLAPKIHDGLKYDTWWQYHYWEEDYMWQIWLLKSYDRISRIEDSLFFEQSETDEKTGKSISPFTIEWYEIVTDFKSTSKSGTTYKTNNHCYLTKVTFNDIKKDFPNWLLLRRDTSENILRKLGMSLFILIMSINLFLHIIVPAFFFVYVNLNLRFLERISNAESQEFAEKWLPVISIILFLYIYHCYSKYLQKKRVRMENIDFEKEFDVYHTDGIKARWLLTPWFMYRLVDFANKMDSSRVYEFYFIKNTMYVKNEYMKWWQDFIEGEFLNVKVLKNMFKNLEQLVIFYLDFKNVVQLSQDLWFEYFDKESFNNKVIRKKGSWFPI